MRKNKNKNLFSKNMFSTKLKVSAIFILLAIYDSVRHVYFLWRTDFTLNPLVGLLACMHQLGKTSTASEWGKTYLLNFYLNYSPTTSATNGGSLHWNNWLIKWPSINAHGDLIMKSILKENTILLLFASSVYGGLYHLIIILHNL